MDKSQALTNLTSSQKAELRMLSELGASAADLAAEKAANAQEVSYLTNNYDSLNWDDKKNLLNYLTTNVSGSGGAFDKVKYYYDKTDDYRQKYNMAFYGGDSDGIENGFWTGGLAYGLYGEDYNKPTGSGRMDAWIDAIQRAESFNPSTFDASKLKAVTDNPNLFYTSTPYRSGANDVGSVYDIYRKNPDGTYSVVGLSTTHNNVANESGGLGGLGGILGAGIGIATGMPWLGGAIGGALSSGSLEGALTGGLLGYAGGDLFSGLGGTSGLGDLAADYASLTDGGSLGGSIGGTVGGGAALGLDPTLANMLDGPSGGGGSLTDWWKQAISPESNYTIPDLVRTAMPSSPSLSNATDAFKLGSSLFGGTPQPSSTSTPSTSGSFNMKINPYQVGLLQTQQPQYQNIFGA